jgi:Cu/Ag efflux protein CusF
MKPLVGILLAAAALCAAPAFAQKPSADEAAAVVTSPGKGAAVHVVTVSASVEAIDKESRVVTLKGPQGNQFGVVAGPEVRNFEEIKVGDQVVVRHVEALSLELKKGGSGVRERVDSESVARTPAGGKPGAAAVRRVTVVADVVAVNPRTQTVTLRGPERTIDLRVRDPNQLKLAKVGDQVQATFTDAVAIAVEPVAGKK